ncbi:Hypothetical predicted protein, partial [Marmota monax]
LPREFSLHLLQPASRKAKTTGATQSAVCKGDPLDWTLQNPRDTCWLLFRLEG